VRGANVEEVGETDIEETKLPTPVLRIYGASVVPCPQLRPTIVARSGAPQEGASLDLSTNPSDLRSNQIYFLVWISLPLFVSFRDRGRFCRR
jgi:hypothetical protein